MKLHTIQKVLLQQRYDLRLFSSISVFAFAVQPKLKQSDIPRFRTDGLITRVIRLAKRFGDVPSNHIISVWLDGAHRKIFGQNILKF